MVVGSATGGAFAASGVALRAPGTYFFPWSALSSPGAGGDADAGAGGGASPLLVLVAAGAPDGLVAAAVGFEVGAA